MSKPIEFQRRFPDVDLTYHEWHRPPTLPKSCYMYDIDSLEARSDLGAVGVVEAKKQGWYPTATTDYQQELMRQIGEALDIPALLVTYFPEGEERVVGNVVVSEGIGRFIVRDLRTGKLYELDEEQYQNVLRGLPKGFERL